MGVNKLFLTNAGAGLAMYCQHNSSSIEFTSFGLGDGENMAPKEAAAMTNEVARFSISRVKEIDPTHYRISGEMPNDKLTEDLSYRELGIYAANPQTGGTVLVYYGNAKGEGFDFTETIPAFSSSEAYSNRKFEVEVFLENDHGGKLTIKDPGEFDSELIAELSNDIGEVQRGLTSETEGRNAADTELGQRIDTEAAARAEADAEINARIETLGHMVSQALVAQLDVTEETTDKIGDLSTLTTASKGNLVAAINELNAAIGAEDPELMERLAMEETTRAGADSALEARIEAEEATRENENTALVARIDAEVTTLGERIDAEVTTREDMSAALEARIEAEETTREDTAAILGERIDAEVTTRENQSAAIEARVITEETTRAEADTALGERIDGEASTRASADSALGARIDSERIGFYNCTTAKGTTAKEVACANVYDGLTITVRFENGNEAANPMIKINGVEYALKLGGPGNVGIGSYYGSSTDGSCIWDAGTELTMYYHSGLGGFRIVGNPIVSAKKTVYAGTTATSPEYRRHIDGLKEIHGAVSAGDLAANSEFKATVNFPFSMATAGYQCTVLPRFGSNTNLHRGAELAYNPKTGAMDVFIYNNSGSAMTGLYIDWSIKGY